ncbi:hypothetical protein MTYP_02958 [Methylophilaceae bacterium]|nr:hypothetical protein MTYP_02958 [Methylophilaceae bacterium]
MKYDTTRIDLADKQERLSSLDITDIRTEHMSVIGILAVAGFLGLLAAFADHSFLIDLMNKAHLFYAYGIA